METPSIGHTSLWAAEQMRLTTSGGIAENKGDLLAGDATELASKLVQFLRQEKLPPQ
jgi:hypothetical protein